MQQRLQSGDENHEQRAALALAEAFGGLPQARWQRQLPPGSAESVDCPPRRTPLRELYRGQWTAKLLSPISELRDHVRM